jgi:hypothetical protein
MINVRPWFGTIRVMSGRCAFSAVARIVVLSMVQACAAAQQTGEPSSGVLAPDGMEYPLYPESVEEVTHLPSPFDTEDRREILVVRLASGRTALLDVTRVEDNTEVNGHRVLFGPGRQLSVGCKDFLTLARTGLHAPEELASVTTITGRPLADIDRLGQPGQISTAGFLAPGENLISVLTADNETVRALGLTHPDLARPLHHLWNLILAEVSHGHSAARSKRIPLIFYGGHPIRLETGNSRGYQESLFEDEIVGNSQIWVERDLTREELSFLRRVYPLLTDVERKKLIERLTRIHTGEMVAYYIQRYGLYEGHTDYRADPVALAWIFGLRSLQQIEEALPGQLPRLLLREWTD